MLGSGQWTTRQLAAHFGSSIKATACAIAQLRANGSAHRCGFTGHLHGDRGGVQAIYCAGLGEEPARSKKRTKPARDKKHRQFKKERKKKRLPVCSVFDLADRYR